MLREDLFRMRDAIDQYYADKNKYPQALPDLVTDGYLREIPEGPASRTPPTRGRRYRPNWTPPIRSPSQASTNVKSGSDQTAMDGSKYADWD